MSSDSSSSSSSVHTALQRLNENIVHLTRDQRRERELQREYVNYREVVQKENDPTGLIAYVEALPDGEVLLVRRAHIMCPDEWVPVRKIGLRDGSLHCEGWSRGFCIYCIVIVGSVDFFDRIARVDQQ